jgi:hypothetical protein
LKSLNHNARSTDLTPNTQPLRDRTLVYVNTPNSKIAPRYEPSNQLVPSRRCKSGSTRACEAAVRVCALSVVSWACCSTTLFSTFVYVHASIVTTLIPNVAAASK